MDQCEPSLRVASSCSGGQGDRQCLTFAEGSPHAVFFRDPESVCASLTRAPARGVGLALKRFRYATINNATYLLLLFIVV